MADITQGAKDTKDMGTSRFVFNFDQAVEEAKRDFPKETRGVTFIDLSAPDAAEKLEAWAQAEGCSQRQLDNWIEKMHSQSAFVASSSASNARLMAIPVDRAPEKWGFRNDREKSAFFVFNHELGHLVVPECIAGDSDKSTEYREHAADVFAVLRSLRQGVLDKKDIVSKADDRGHAMLFTGDITHLTSMSLDAVAINPKNTDFVSLSAKEIVKIAQKHAHVFEMDRKTESAFLGVRRAGMSAQMEGEMNEAVEQRLHALSYICLTAPRDSMQFYIAARILNNALESGKITYQGEEAAVDKDNEHWQHVRDAIRQKTGNRDIGARKALETPELTRPEKNDLLTRFSKNFTRLKI